MNTFATDTEVASQVLPAALSLGAVHLTVTDLERSIEFYEQAIGLRLRERDGDARRASLGAGGDDVLVLVEQTDARAAGRHAGLYHVALLFPSRLELARAAARLAHTRTPIQGASDHGTHEAFYLPDPDGNGLELAADRPREQWPDITSAGGYGGGPRPLDVADLMSLVAGEGVQAHAQSGLVVGHMHLHVGDVAAALDFYRDVLGFELIADLGTAAFVSVGGYHHHLAFNVWAGRGVGAAPADAVGLRHWTIVLPSAEDVDAVRARLARAGVTSDSYGAGLLVADPWGIRVAVKPRGG